jgi:uncharacterized protein (TIGR02996 family)
MPSEADLLAAIAAHPGEVERWLILADWLEDQDDPRAELARLRWQLQTTPRHRQRNKRLARQQKLLDGGLRPVVPMVTGALGIPFALVLPGTFHMGSKLTEKDRQRIEVRHQVTLTEPFFLGIYPVTVGEFRAFVEATGYETDAERGRGALGCTGGYTGQEFQVRRSFTWRTPGYEQEDRHPVTCVSYNDAQAMIACLNKQEGGSGSVYSLPTEAQWEHACRAGTQTTFWWGDNPARLKTSTWYFSNSRMQAHPVETKKPNPWGLYHMLGMVWEWCADGFRTFTKDPVVDPSGTPDPYDRQYPTRGGSWGNDTNFCRAAYRCSDSSRDAWSCRGFRLALRCAPGE